MDPKIKKNYFHAFLAIFVLASIGIIIFIPSYGMAQISNSFSLSALVPFGGRIVVYVPALAIPPCPSHTVVIETHKVPAKLLGVYAVPGASKIYAYFNLFRPGTPILGQYGGVPFPSCPFPWKVYPIFQVGTGGPL